MNEHEKLNELLEATPDAPTYGIRLGVANQAQPGYPPPALPPEQTRDMCQWQVGANNTFRPAAATIQRLVAGAYTPRCDQLGPYLERQPLLCDEIVELPESANLLTLNSIRKFWLSRARYEAHGLLFKRGILLWGPPGSGKTVTVHLLTRDLIAADGVVILASDPNLTTFLVSALRRIEPERNLIVVLEDIDEIIARHCEHEILSMLDGENQTANVVYIATTNYPERLGARIVNRPSRFDERIYVGMPTYSARLTYLQKAASNGAPISGETAAAWSKDTDGLSIAHLRELVAAVLCLDQEYGDVLRRLRSMAQRPKDVEGFDRPRAGIV